VFLVAGSINESQWPLSRATTELSELLLLITQFGRIATLKLVETLRIVTEPAP
jgi:hypothetical protein